MFAIIMFVSTILISTSLILLFTFGFKKKKIKKKEIATLESIIETKDIVSFEYMMHQIIAFNKTDSLKLYYPDLRQYCLDKEFIEAIKILDELNY